MQTCVGSRGVTYGLPIRFQPALRLSEGFVIGVWIMVSGCEGEMVIGALAVRKVNVALVPGWVSPMVYPWLG